MALPSPGPLTRFGMFLLAAGVVLIFAALGLLRHLSESVHPASVSRPGDSHAVGGGFSPATAPTPTRARVDPAAVARLNETISQALAVLRDPTNPKRKEALAALREALARAEPHVAIAAIRQFLASGQDASTGLRFKLGDDHALDGAPTMRTFLMDQLGAISRDAGTTDAAEVARAILDTKRVGGRMGRGHA